VTPAPDGRGGGQQTPQPSRRNARWVVVLAVLALLGLNLFISSQALQPASRVAVPYYPTFINQVDAGNVSSISSTGNSVQGTFKTAVKYPSDSQTAQPTTRFSTQIPSFANGSSLQNLLQAHGVTINAHPLSTGPAVWESLLFGFGPTLLFLLLIFWFIRRAAAPGG
jgi:cell division protease FtsH